MKTFTNLAHRAFKKCASLSTSNRNRYYLFTIIMLLTLGVTNAWAQTVTWEKATSIAAGDVVALVCESKKTELSGISTTSTKYGTGVDYTSAPVGKYELTVEEGSSAGTFSFKNGTTYLYWTSGNSLATTSPTFNFSI